MFDKITETAPVNSQGRSILACQSAFAQATRVSGPTPVVTHSGDVSRLEPTTSMVLRSQTRGGRSSAAIPDVEVRQEIEFRQEPEVDYPAEIQVSVSNACEEGLDVTGPTIAERPSEIAETDCFGVVFLVTRYLGLRAY